MRVLLVCSSGGHLQQMLALEPAWRGMERAWVTLPGPDVDYLLAAEQTTLGHGPTNRSLVNLFRNLGLAWRLLRKRRPEAILSTGAGLAVPFFLVGRLLGIRLVYVESVTRTESISLSGRLAYPFASRFFAQWPAAADRLERAEYRGGVL
ncbi:MAG TPA: PssD/Cps14F family polysaccharide biosynthesis glycosyltransferase [Solirubrobacterales bacterium]|nr:PssD/Cps14F family polysaccharide biosynthesis glycosyltransferase [Solirubrobacterales bacterium]